MATVMTLRFSPLSYSYYYNNRAFHKFQSIRNLKSSFILSGSTSSSFLLQPSPRKNVFLPKLIVRNEMDASTTTTLPFKKDTPLLSGVEDIMIEYIFGKRRATEVAHSVWKHVVQQGDALVDATCGNGNDTLAMVKMVANQSQSGRVYAMDVQKIALDNTQYLLDESLNQEEKELVKLFATCHSKMEEVVPRDNPVRMTPNNLSSSPGFGLSRLVAFNLGYLPGGDKAIITKSETTLLGLEAAERIVASGGLISIVVYVGHPGGREEFETVEAFAAGLPVEKWICSKLQMLNRPLAPVLVFLSRR